MASGIRRKQVGVLRDVIARIESGGHGALRAFGRRRADMVTLGGEATPDGCGTMLDAVLGGGLRRDGIHEVVAASAGDAPAACGFALALAARFAAARGGTAPVVWIVEDAARAETGIPYAPGLALHGIDPARLVVVHTANAADALWAAEEAVSCRTLAAVVAEIWRCKGYDLVASRRLALAAGRSGTPGLVVPAGAAGGARELSSAARTRFEVRAMPGRYLPSAGERMPLPGCIAWDVRLARIRAGPDGVRFSVDPDRFWPVLWDGKEALFRDALPLPVPAAPGDRPDRARQDALRDVSHNALARSA